MASKRIRKTYMIFMVLFGVLINSAYCIDLLKEFFAPQFNNAVREILISAIALEFGWAAMLLWVAFKPFERRHLILFTAMPMIIGNLLHSINQSTYHDGSTGAIAVNLIIGFVLAGLFIFAFFLGDPNSFEKPKNS